VNSSSTVSTSPSTVNTASFTSSIYFLSFSLKDLIFGLDCSFFIFTLVFLGPSLTSTQPRRDISFQNSSSLIVIDIGLGGRGVGDSSDDSDGSVRSSESIVLSVLSISSVLSTIFSSCLVVKIGLARLVNMCLII
jgi:hypothetical protein